MKARHVVQRSALVADDSPHPVERGWNDLPLVAVMRGAFIGSVHRGALAVVDASGRLVLCVGDPDLSVFLRSAAKPFQVLPAVLSGAIDRYGITTQELAVMCASHNGEPRHLERVAQVLEKIGLDESALQCGTHAPLNLEAAADRWKSGLEPSPICNNCSGAHTAMLVACRAMRWPLHDYGHDNHPLQRQTRQLIASFAGVDPDSIQLAVDNCAVPTFRLPLRNAAQAFARLATGQQLPEDLALGAGRVVMAMTGHPEMVGGVERFDTDLMVETRGTVVAKGGAEGFQGVASVPDGLGLAVKISDGNARAIPPTVMRLLEHLHAIDPVHADALWRYREPELHDLVGDPVGKLVPVFTVGNIA